MNTKTRRILAIIALVFMVVFTVTLILVLFNAKMGGGAVLYVAIGSGVIGIAIYFILWFDNRRKQNEEEMKRRLAEATADEREASAETGADSPENVENDAIAAADAGSTESGSPDAAKQNGMTSESAAEKNNKKLAGDTSRAGKPKK